MSAERDYKNTGPKVSDGIPWLKISAKEATIQVDGKEATSFAGYIDDIGIQWDQGNAEYEIQPHWRLVLTMSAQTDSGEIKQYKVGFPFYWAVLTQNVINALLGVLPGWGGYFYFRLYKKDSHVRIYIETMPGVKAPNGIPFDEQTNTWQGSPIRKFIGTIKGRDYYDTTEIDEWWLQHAVTAASKFLGRPYMLPNKDSGAVIPQGQQSAPPTPPAADQGAQQTQAPPPPKQLSPQEAESNFFAYLDGQLKSTDSLQSVIALYEKAYKAASEKKYNTVNVSLRCETYAKRYSPNIALHEGKWMELPGGITTQDDDLPF